MIELFWHEAPIPKDMHVSQVYGVPFTSDGRVLMKVDHINGKRYFSLAGGTVEKFDKEQIATLCREFKEEVNTTIFSPIYLGYQEVRGDGDRAPYAQVRMACRVDKIGERLLDPDNGKTYERALVSPEKAKVLLSWGDIGNRIIEKATEVAKNEYKITVNETDNEEWV